MKARIYLGTQGWNYEGWAGSFYPSSTKSKETLGLYAKIFDSVEIDSTFYAVPAEGSVRGWAERTPSGFKFSAKLPSEITHKNRLQDSKPILDHFIQRISLLGDKLGCILIQLPPDFSPAERNSLSAFLKLLPKNPRFAIEFRDPKWVSSETLEELRSYNVAFTLADGRWINRDVSISIADQPTADFSYLRWLGPRDLTDFSRIQIDRAKELKRWADAVENLTPKVSTIFGYFNNHFQGHSPASCNIFKAMLKLPIVEPSSLIVQPSLF
ncbi:MAG TPA: DUF72 domain-containing protein [Blastocatellia bacterium]|nr:DUF72 domain-containing protein [Blastocatellia bacterium]